MVEPSQKCKEILCDIYDSEELKIVLNRCKANAKAIAKIIEMLCTTGNSAFNDCIVRYVMYAAGALLKIRFVLSGLPAYDII